MVIVIPIWAILTMAQIIYLGMNPIDPVVAGASSVGVIAAIGAGAGAIIAGLTNRLFSSSRFPSSIRNHNTIYHPLDSPSSGYTHPDYPHWLGDAPIWVNVTTSPLVLPSNVPSAPESDPYVFQDLGSNVANTIINRYDQIPDSLSGVDEYSCPLQRPAQNGSVSFGDHPIHDSPRATLNTITTELRTTQCIYTTPWYVICLLGLVTGLSLGAGVRIFGPKHCSKCRAQSLSPAPLPSHWVIQSVDESATSFAVKHSRNVLSPRFSDSIKYTEGVEAILGWSSGNTKTNIVEAGIRASTNSSDAGATTTSIGLSVMGHPPAIIDQNDLALSATPISCSESNMTLCSVAGGMSLECRTGSDEIFSSMESIIHTLDGELGYNSMPGHTTSHARLTDDHIDCRAWVMSPVEPAEPAPALCTMSMAANRAPSKDTSANNVEMRPAKRQRLTSANGGSGVTGDTSADSVHEEKRHEDKVNSRPTNRVKLEPRSSHWDNRDFTSDNFNYSGLPVTFGLFADSSPTCAHLAPYSTPDQRALMFMAPSMRARHSQLEVIVESEDETESPQVAPGLPAYNLDTQFQSAAELDTTVPPVSGDVELDPRSQIACPPTPEEPKGEGVGKNEAPGPATPVLALNSSNPVILAFSLEIPQSTLAVSMRTWSVSTPDHLPAPDATGASAGPLTRKSCGESTRVQVYEDRALPKQAEDAPKKKQRRSKSSKAGRVRRTVEYFRKKADLGPVDLE